MELHTFTAEADLIGRRIRLRWTVTFEEGETLADEPVVRVRRKQRDFQFLPPPPAGPDPFEVYHAAAFPPAGSVASDLPVEERRSGTVRTVEAVTSVSQTVGGVAYEVLRRTRTTTLRDDGQPLERRVELIDFGLSIGGLVPNTTYYYVLETPAGPTARATARPGEGYGISRRLYDMLPAIHRRHDTVARGLTPGAEAVAEAAPHAGQLQRFFDLFGTALDLMRTTAEGLPGLHDLDHVDARYLPLLARWIGWDLSVDRSIPTQRHELRNAPALYRLTGTIPSAHMWTRYATGWTTRVKEYIHNVVRSNEPPSLNLWLRSYDGAAWSDPERAFLLDAAPTGRPVTVETSDATTWLFYHTHRMNRWGVWAKTYHPGDGWSDGAPVTTASTDNTHPTAAVRPDGTLWLAWTEYDPIRKRWAVRLRTRAPGGAFGAPTTLREVLGLSEGDRRYPTATVDADGHLWIFWMERAGTVWRLRYSRFDGAWSGAVDLPDDGATPVDVEARPFAVAFDTAAPTRRLWLFWRQTRATGQPGQTRSVLAFRTKGTLDADAAGWGAVASLSALPPTFHDDDPSAYVNADGELELVFASTRALGWSLWRRTFDAAADAWRPAEALPATPYRERHPWPLVLNGQRALLYRSDRSPVYESDEPGGIRSADFRYSGSTMPDTANGVALGLHGQYGDFGSYTTDLGRAQRADDDRYAEDTVGLFLTPGTIDADDRAESVSRLRQVLPLCLPVTERAVFVLPEEFYAEYVYDYLRPGLPAPRVIDAAYLDTFTSTLGTEVFGDELDFTDTLDEP